MSSYSLSQSGTLTCSVGTYLFKVNNGNTRTMYEICSKLRKRHQNDVTEDFAPCYGISIVDFEHANVG